MLNTKNVFTITCDQFNVSLLNKSINFLFKKSYRLQTFKWSCIAESWEAYLTMVIFSGGVVGKFGEEKVKPLSVPASNGCKSKVTSCFHCPPSHRFRLSTPTNQSGLGITFTIRDSCERKHNMISHSRAENIHTDLISTDLHNDNVLAFSSMLC